MGDPCSSGGLVCVGSWYKHGPVLLVSWLLVFIACPLAVFSVVLLATGVRRLLSAPADSTLDPVSPRKATTTSVVRWHSCAALSWVLVMGASLYPLVRGNDVMLVVLVPAAVLTSAHAIVMHLLSGKRQSVLTDMYDMPAGSLLPARKIASDAPDQGLGTLSSPVSPEFVPTYGLVPGTSEYTLQFIIPQQKREPRRQKDARRTAMGSPFV